MQLKVNKELFKQKAEEKGLAQGQIAEKIGVKRDWVVRFLQAKNLSQIKTVKALCDLLEININELITSKDENN